VKSQSSESALVGEIMDNHLSSGLIRRARLRIATHVALLGAQRQSARRARQLGFGHVLVLCYGNIYRSPFVAEYISRFLETTGFSCVRSAGFHPKVERPTPDDFVVLARERAGIDLSRHRSRLVSTEDFEWADVVLIMDRHNWHAVANCSAGANALSRVIWLGALGNSGSVEINDPYGASVDVKADIMDELIESANEFCRIIRERCAGARGDGGSTH
jgi:protein-tyrosine phosphatase